MTVFWHHGRKLLAIALLLVSVPAISAGQERVIRLVFAGDLMAHVPNYSIKPFDSIYEGIRFILDRSDLNFINLEFPINDALPYESYPTFNVHSEYALAAITAGFNVFSLANNHSADQGSKGVAKTHQAMLSLKNQVSQTYKRDIWFNGLRPTEKSAPYSLTIIEKSGIRIGFVAIAEWVNFPPLKKWVQYADFRENPQPLAFVEWLKQARKSVDLLVLSYHWGDEYINQQNALRNGISRILTQAGVDIIWGNHPHVLQPWYSLETSRGRSLVMPSCGNFISGQTWHLGPKDYARTDAPKGDSMLLSVEVTIDARGHIGFKQIEPILIASWKTETGQMVTRTMADLVRNSDSDWRDFYRYRLSSMAGLIPNSLENSISKGFRQAYPTANIPE